MFALLAPSSKSHLAESPAPADEAPAITISDLRFAWHFETTPILDIAGLDIESGQRVFIEGPSGSGKSTLLGLLVGVSIPQNGRIRVLGRALASMGGAQRDRFRADHLGVIFQMFNLIPYLTVQENVTLPCRFSPRRRDKARRRSGSLENEAMRLLEHLGMADPALLRRPVTDLSVGQQQRVAAARALMGGPEIVIADEPTSSLDAGRRQDFIRLLFEECGRNGTTLIFVSHDTALAPLFDRTISLSAINRAGGRPQTSAKGVR